jgi:flagellar hook-associated protein 2
VKASIITDATGARLSLQSASTGAASAFKITATGAAAPLAYDATVASPMTRTQTAADAQATINGIAITSASNTLTNVVSGLTINLLKPTTAAVTVSVAADTASITKAITDFVTAFNGVAGFLHTQTQYSATTQTAGALQGDSAAIGLQSQLRGIINQVSTASATFGTLSSVGITIQKDGTLAIDSTKLTNAEGNLAELRKMMITAGANSASSGFIARFKSLADAALSFNGTFQSRNNSLNARLKANSNDQTSMQRRLDQTQARLTAQRSEEHTSELQSP